MYTLLTDQILKLLNIEVEVIKKCEHIHNVIVSNHVSEIDPVLILYAIQDYNVRFIAGSIPKQNPFFRTICNWFDAIFIEQDKTIAYDELTRQIKQDDTICIFPEGTLLFKSSIERSNLYCDKTGIRKFKNVLAPREAGFSMIRGLLNSQHSKYTDITLLYDVDTKESTTPLTIVDFFNMQPKKIKIIIDETDLPITDTYRKKDRIIEKYNRYLRKQYLLFV